MEDPRILSINEQEMKMKNKENEWMADDAGDGVFKDSKTS